MLWEDEDDGDEDYSPGLDEWEDELDDLLSGDQE